MTSIAVDKIAEVIIENSSSISKDGDTIVKN